MLLEIRDYHYQFPAYPGLAAAPLFSGLDLNLDRGEIRIVLGAPESGKTTLGRCLTGVYPGMTQAEWEGNILIDGEAVVSRSACDWIETMGTVFQDPEEQIVGTRCDDEAVMALESMGFSSLQMKERLERAFGAFSLEGKEGRNPLSLSGGEKKRLLLAALEMQDPDLWILDETLDELDLEGQHFLLDYLKTLAADRHKGILLFASKYKASFRDAEIPLALIHGGRLSREEDCTDFQALLESEGLISMPRAVVPSSDSSAVPKSDTPLFKLENLQYCYPGNEEFSLHIPSLSIGRGEILALCGPNGCGKTTLARILCGLIAPDSGQIAGNGRSLSPEELNLACGYLFQNPDYQLFLPTVEEELALGLRYSGMKREERKRRCDEARKLFALPGGEAPPALLSFGARKKLQGAIYSLLEKELYILDEADSGLGFRDYLTIMEQLASRGASLLVISHDETVQNLGAHRIIRMKKGRLDRGSVGSVEDKS